MEAIVFYLLMLQKIYQFKAKDSEIEKYLLCLGNNSKDFSVNNILLTSIVSPSNDTNCVSFSNQRCMLNLLLLIYILMNTVKNSIIIRFWLI